MDLTIAIISYNTRDLLLTCLKSIQDMTKDVAGSRSEPIFYNGKTYHLDFSSMGGGTFDMAVSGMGPKQRQDAVAVATSSLGYFACPEGQRGKLQNEPAYADTKWRMQARCG